MPPGLGAAPRAPDAPAPRPTAWPHSVAQMTRCLQRDAHSRPASDPTPLCVLRVPSTMPACTEHALRKDLVDGCLT